MRVGLLVTCLSASVAAAEPRLEASGFVGLGVVGNDLQLGDSWAPEQKPGSAPLVGARLHVLLAPDLAHDDHWRVQLGVETELAIATAFTGSTVGMDARDAYFAPVLGWRGHLRLRLAGKTGPSPHVITGAGGATVASSSPYMRKETDPLFYWGAGIGIPVAERWDVRLDARHGLTTAQSGMTSTFELQFGLAARFELAQRRIPPPRREPPPPQPVVDETDTDEDGLPDVVDACASDAETVNGTADDDGCPEPDADGDGVLAAEDRCPDAAEDLDQFEDADGCPDTDNDRDGLVDTADRCPMEPETANSFDDGDGCADVLPPELASALAAKVVFEAKRARVTSKAKAALAPLRKALAASPQLRILILGGAPGEELAGRRANAVKWHLVDEGIAEDRIETAVGVTDATRVIEIRLR